MKTKIDKPVMTDKGAWKFTEKQIRKIQAFDIESINKFFEDNYKIVEGMAYKRMRIYWERRKTLIEVNDLINQVYVDLPYYDFSSRIALWYDIVKGSFLFLEHGGICNKDYAGYNSVKVYNCSSIDIQFQNSNDTSAILDKITYTVDFVENKEIEKERNRRDKLILEFLEKTIKYPKALNFMFCKVFLNLSEKKVKGNEYDNFRRS